MIKRVIIERKYCGPPNSGNGGYSAGILAEAVDFSVQVTLRKPPPLDKEMTLEISENRIAMKDGVIVIAEAKAHEFEITDIPIVPDYEEVIEASKNYVGHELSPFPNCFVCGSHRKLGDGLQIYAGSVRDKVVAAPWQPFKALASNGKIVDKKFVWSALDCPGAWASTLNEERMIVLGRMSVKQFNDILVGKDYIIMGWEKRVEGRKVFTGTAIFTKRKVLCAVASQIWIEIKQ